MSRRSGGRQRQRGWDCATDEQLLALGIGVRNDVDVARDAGVTHQAIAWRRRKLGLPPVERSNSDLHRARADEITSAIKTAVEAGAVGVAGVARETGLRDSNVSRWIRLQGLDVGDARLTRYTREIVAAVLTPDRTILEASQALGLRHVEHIYKFINRYGLWDLRRKMRYTRPDAAK